MVREVVLQQVAVLILQSRTLPHGQIALPAMVVERFAHAIDFHRLIGLYVKWRKIRHGPGPAQRQQCSIDLIRAE